MIKERRPLMTVMMMMMMSVVMDYPSLVSPTLTTLSCDSTSRQLYLPVSGTAAAASTFG